MADMGSVPVARLQAGPSWHAVSPLIESLLPFLDALHEPVVCTDLVGEVRHTNPAFDAAWHLPRGQRLAATSLDADTVAVDVADRGGEARSVHLRLTLVRDELGNPHALVGRAQPTNGQVLDELRRAAAVIASALPHLADPAPAVELDPELAGRLETLSAREREILDLLLEGNRVATAAQALFLSENTVRNYLKRIYRKLGVHSLGELRERLGTTHLRH